MNRTIVTILLAAALVAAPSAPFAGESEVTNEAFEVGKNARLSLSNLNGPATITGGSGNKIEITATKRTSGSLERLDGATDPSCQRLRLVLAQAGGEQRHLLAAEACHDAGPAGL